MAIERWYPSGTSMDRRDDVSDIQTQVNRLFDNFFGRAAPSSIGRAWAPASGGRPWVPPIDLYETKDDLVLALELPGIRDKDVTVSITGDLLSIKGERRPENSPERQMLHAERVFGSFERLVQLPISVQTDKVKASCRDGVLEIRLPKSDDIKPREIKVDIL